MKSIKDIYIFIGPPGSGKGSLSHLCKKNFGWAHLSTGNLCRQHIARMTDIGVQIDQILKSGKLIHDDLMIAMVSAWIQEVAEHVAGVILDGFPRTVEQARALDALFSQDFFAQASITVVAMHIHDDHILGRLKTRFVCENESCQVAYSYTSHESCLQLTCKECDYPLKKRTDDASDVVYERLKIYHQYAGTLLDYYKNSWHKMITLNAELPLENVFNSFMQSTGK